MLSYQIDTECTRMLIALNEAILEKYTLISSLSAKDKESIHHHAWISMVGASTRIENAILTDTEVDWLDAILSKDGRQTAFESYRNKVSDKLSKDKEHEKTNLPVRTIANVLKTLVAKQFIQRHGLGSATYYQLVF